MIHIQWALRIPCRSRKHSEHFGDFQACGAYCRFFQAEIDRRGVDQVLRTYVSPLLTGVAAHAFHPLLRLGYGIDLDDRREIALGLGYWAATYLPAPDAPASNSNAEKYREQALQLLDAGEWADSTAALEAQYQLISVLVQTNRLDEAAKRLEAADRLAGSRLTGSTHLAFQAHWTRAGYYKLRMTAATADIASTHG